ncbi:MAG: hypothetical protein D0530_09225 [Methylococcales bacterium]|nr:MAG: hypothetical protein D0530_09225 [Methylococcales bacterium]
MILTTYQKIIYGLVLLGIVVMVTIPDMVIELSTELFHLIFELIFEVADVTFESVETMLDNVIEHLFHTGLHDTQIIVYYVIVSVLAYPLYRLVRVLLRYLFRILTAIPIKYADYKNQWLLLRQDISYYWQKLPFISKLKWVLITTSILYLASFLVM